MADLRVRVELAIDHRLGHQKRLLRSDLRGIYARVRDVAFPGEDDGLALSLAATLPIQEEDVASDDYRSLYELGTIRKSEEGRNVGEATHRLR